MPLLLSVKLCHVGELKILSVDCPDVTVAVFYMCSMCPCLLIDNIWGSELWCLSGDKRGDYQNCSVLYCVLKLCTVISTLRWAVLTVLWIGFCHTGLILLCIALFVFICVYFVCFCFILHSCCIIVSVVGWTWWDWSPILRTYFLQCFDIVGWVIWPVKTLPRSDL